MGKLDRSSRFQDKPPQQPGPGAYNTSLYASYSKLELSSPPHRSQSPTDKFNQSSRPQKEKLYFHEYEKAWKNRAGPGPGHYKFEDVNSSFSRLRGLSIARSNRYAEPRSQERRIPISYATINQDISVRLKSNPKATFPKFAKRMDPRKMTSIHATLWKKGVLH